MNREIMNTKEVAEYLGLNEKRIYQLAKLGEIPAARIGGKWVFPRSLMDQWIIDRARGNLKGAASVPAHILLVMGSNDFAWEVISHMLQDAPFHMVVSMANVGSTGGLIALEQGLAHVAGIHLFDPESGRYNLPVLPKFLSGKALAVFHLFKRHQGLMVKRGNPLKITGIEDLARPEVRFVNRQKGSGTRLLLDHELTRSGVSPEAIRGYYREVETHLAVAMEILRGRVDCGVGVASIATSLGLGFIPLREEAYDLVILKEALELPQVRALLKVIRSGGFREALKGVGGYGLEGSGEKIWEGVV